MDFGVHGFGLGSVFGLKVLILHCLTCLNLGNAGALAYVRSLCMWSINNNYGYPVRGPLRRLFFGLRRTQSCTIARGNHAPLNVCARWLGGPEVKLPNHEAMFITLRLVIGVR